MKFSRLNNQGSRLLLIAAFILLPINLKSAAAQTAPNININASVASSKLRRGGMAQAAVTIEIPRGYHVNSSRPLEKFLIPTQLTVEAPKGIRVGPVGYPRALLRSFKFSKNKVSVYEGRAVLRFNLSALRTASIGSTEVKLRLRFQSCNDEVCFPPQTREMSVWVNVEG